MITNIKNIIMQKRALLLLIIIYAGFISLGLPDSTLGVSWDYIRKTFDKPVYYAGVITVAVTIFSAISAFASGYILKALGTGRLLAICASITGLSILCYAVSPYFWTIILCVLPLGFGQGAIDTGMNHYVAKNYTSRDMNWLHCCWGIGASLGPIIITSAISKGFTWRTGYLIIAIIQLCLASIFFASLKLWKDDKDIANEECPSESTKVIYNGRFFASPLMFFLYCGIEFSIGLWAFQFLVNTRGIAEVSAGYIVSGYWIMLTAGRFIAGIFVNKIGNRLAIRLSMSFAVVTAITCALSTNSTVSTISIAAMGFCFATFYPSMMHETPRRFNAATATVLIGWQGGAGMLGVAIVPALLGYLFAQTTFSLLPYFAAAICSGILILQIFLDGIRNTEDTIK